jgi:hypothetical protein
MNKNHHNNKIINELAEYIFANPEAKRSKILAKFGNKWQVSPRTFDRFLQQAKEYNQLRLASQQAAVNARITDTAMQKVEQDIINRQQMLTELTKIAKGGKHGEAIRAMDLIAKIEGYYAPVKQAVTDSAGNDMVVEKPLSAEEIQKFMEELENKY